jgi:hypothetical protein
MRAHEENMRNQVWSEDELILTLEIYNKFKGRISDVPHPEVVALASELAELAMIDSDGDASSGRSRAAIIFKMSNFRALDPKARARGKLGLYRGGAEDRAAWKEFADRPNALFRAATIRELRAKEAIEKLEAAGVSRKKTRSVALRKRKSHDVWQRLFHRLQRLRPSEVVLGNLTF